MKLIIRNSILFFFVILIILFIGNYGTEIYYKVDAYLNPKEGTIRILNMDEKSGKPIKDSVFHVMDSNTNEILEVLQTKDNGVAISNPLPIDQSYTIKQAFVIPPYEQIEEPWEIRIKSEEQQSIVSYNNTPTHISAYNRLADGRINVTSAQLHVDTVLQTPELPNGCEITAATSVLNYYGYSANKIVMADKYLPKVSFTSVNNKLYGGNPYEVYAGDPFSERQGFYTYPPPIVHALEEFLDDVGGSHQVHDISGSSMDELFQYILNETPVIVWTTIDVQEPRDDYSWYLYDSNEKIDVLRNSHTLVLTGFDENVVYTMDPLKGQVTYPLDEFIDIYEKTGRHAVIIQ